MRSAFTLVEVLATLTISSLLVVCVMSATRGLTTTREKVGTRVERSLGARQAMDSIVSALRNVRHDPKQRYPVVVGRSGGRGAANDRIDLLVFSDLPARGDGAESDQYEVAFYLMQRPGQPFSSLVCRKDHALDDFPEDGGLVTVIADGITGLSFEYFSEEEWQTEWAREQIRTPRAVRVTVQASSLARGPSGEHVETSVLSSIVPLRAGKSQTVIQPEQNRPEPEKPG